MSPPHRRLPKTTLCARPVCWPKSFYRINFFKGKKKTLHAASLEGKRCAKALRSPRYGLVFSPYFSMSLGGPSWPCGKRGCRVTPCRRKWPVACHSCPPAPPPPPPFKAARSHAVALFPAAPTSASAPHDKAKGRSMPLPGPTVNSGQQILTRDLPAGRRLLRPRLWAAGHSAASWTPTFPSPDSPD